MIVAGKECEVVIFKGHQVLGLLIAGGVDTPLGDIFIQQLLPDSPAAKDGRLQPGDQVLRVNGASMKGATSDDALKALQHPDSFMQLTILRPLPKPAQNEGETLPWVYTHSHA